MKQIYLSLVLVSLFIRCDSARPLIDLGEYGMKQPINAEQFNLRIFSNYLLRTPDSLCFSLFLTDYSTLQPVDSVTVVRVNNEIRDTTVFNGCLGYVVFESSWNKSDTLVLASRGYNDLYFKF